MEDRRGRVRMLTSPKQMENMQSYPDKTEGAGQTSEEKGKKDTPEDRQPDVSSDVKSSAVVKYVKMEGPAKYLQLQQDTNLNEPPANWLQGTTKWETYLRDASLGKHKDQSHFSSFKMAYGFPELTGNIDIVSDSENIKKLLKIPWCKDHVSMMVHRVGNTLLLDEFDIHKHMLRKQQEQWQWMRKFFYETVLRNMEENAKNIISKKNKTRDYLQHRNLESKFLYYSTGMSPNRDSSNTEPDTVQALQEQPHKPVSEHHEGHQRNVLWEFEDLHMLIGTDLPIFGGATHPCVSLRLRDMRKPISVLTGLDYWLDNLMCNVPELAMCYHLDGIVKGYELLKTEDIPNIEESKFSPTVVKDIAQNILSFLKANATKEGHTYWLFKAHDDDIVKLYDLTTLCADCMGDKSANPFTVPVGILLFKMAQNMWQSSGRKHSGTIRTLLQNCLLLLDKNKYPQLVATANFILSDIYITNDIHNMREASPTSTDESDEEDTEYESSESPAESSVDVQTLCIRDSMKKSGKELARLPPVSGDTQQRCQESLKYIAQGLACIDNNMKEEKTRSKYQVDQQEQCNPFEPIPLNYAPLGETSTLHNQLASDIEASNSAETESQRKHMLSVWENWATKGSWHDFSRAVLFRKAVVAYYGLAEVSFQVHKYGETLRYLKQALQCLNASMVGSQPDLSSSYSHILSAVLSLCGDCHVMLSHQKGGLEEHTEAYQQQTEDEQVIEECATQDGTNSEYWWLGELTAKPELSLTRGVEAYEAAIKITLSAHRDSSSQLQHLKKRLGNAENERGVLYMNAGAAKISEIPESSPLTSDIKKLLQKAEKCFKVGIQCFEDLKDKMNSALLYSNQGRLMRVYVQGSSLGLTDAKIREFSPQERNYFNKALDNYKTALELLKVRHQCPEIWDSINWELSSTYFSMATLMQDYAPLSSMAQEQVEKEVTELMNKALKHCDVETNSTRLPTCQYRAATIHHRLASLYHNSYRNTLVEQKKKHLRTLAELHYQKASQLFSAVDSPCEWLRVLLEQVAMCEFYLDGLTSQYTRLRTLQTALQHLMACRQPLESIVQQLGEAGEDGDLASYQEEMTKLLPILHSRLTYILLNLVKITVPTKKGKQDGLQHQQYKAMYTAVLKAPAVDTSALDTSCRVELQLIQTLLQLLPEHR